MWSYYDCNWELSVPKFFETYRELEKYHCSLHGEYPQHVDRDKKTVYGVWGLLKSKGYKFSSK